MTTGVGKKGRSTRAGKTSVFVDPSNNPGASAIAVGPGGKTSNATAPFQQVQDVNAAKATTAGPAASPQQQSVDDIIAWAKQRYGQDQTTIGDALNKTLPSISAAGYTADQSEQGIGLGLGIQYGILNADPTMQYAGDAKSAAGSAVADPRSIAAQNYALNKLLGRTDPTISGPERLMMEQSRRDEEQGLKANRDAVLENLQRRGVAGSGAEVASMLGAQQTQSGNRQMQDLGAQANAVLRSQQALQNYGTVATNMRAGSAQEAQARAHMLDVTEQFNKQARSDYNNFYQTTQGARAKDLAGVQAGIVADKYQHHKDWTDAVMGGAKAKIGVAQTDSAPVSSALTTSLGQNNLDAAIAQLNKKHGVFGSGIGPDLFPNAFG